MAKKKAIKKAFDKWITRLGLRWWKLTIRYYDDPGEIISRFRHDDDLLVLARTYADWRYLQATIDINLPAWKEVKDVDEAVIHELVHVLVNEMREGGMTHEERVVTLVTKAILWAVDMERQDANRFTNESGLWTQDINCFSGTATVEKAE